ncbi:fructose-bisphosphate aldolase class II [Breznakia sp. PF5-3]|uniref:class II fructose-bisphosphate aldolase n=1 Tax=unclassified Breznakia TaxID=2623764 RepID=UPI0024058565|nr:MULTISPECIES: class II fructose-bisphosphate aldolase [unclassified Breznakia]MDL2276015.1 class II fructose-bisphosphate aldolase [Breznakia sp. OttesenSCG-928-G09]MDF9824342.1 fructose-bisphosphate aldolase class II [Breznakia sp. PM6-1]MDF9835067.1 fructose-bisphosphate aldolase class II [Breznakia sp. PF5-3]MDF9837762.1 fructose-bisphosphate aldolase class II [Breznakia sp. PFB2-8]MDF9859641.1 fructose-bisphosphate aldolase class II [Breznakia sp. PH5-24]
MYVSMKGMLERANKENYAVMAINCFNIETARAVIDAAQQERAPIIVNIVQEHMVEHCDSALIAPIVRELAQRASVEVALNFDHGEEIGLLKKAIVDGYSSVMVDASRFDLEGNIKMTKEIVDFAKAYDVSVEGEIGCMGGSEGGKFTKESMLTDVAEAKRFAYETGIDALAISIGTSHGNYPEGYVPEFDFNRLKEIKEATKMPLVLHGGSGSGDENIKQCVAYGINKINVGCDFMNANVASIKKHLEKDPDINYWVMMHQVEKDSQQLVRHYIQLSKSSGKSL